MKWQDGFPVDEGATDTADSARLAGIMATFRHPEAVDCDYYVDVGDVNEWQYWRHPVMHNKNEHDEELAFSRDQAVCLFAGLYSQGFKMYVDPNYQPPNGDVISPSVRDHFRICSGGQPTFLGQLWLMFDILWMCAIDKDLDTENNQLLCMLMVHPDKRYLKLYLKHDKNWKFRIVNYWSRWREEYELAGLIFKELKKYE